MHRWRDLAACKGVNPDLFYPPKGGTEHMNAAKSICMTCPVIIPCREYGIEHEDIGIWGGWASKELKRERKRRKITISRPQADIQGWRYQDNGGPRRTR